MKNPHKIEFLVQTFFIIIIALGIIFCNSSYWIDHTLRLAFLALIVMQLIGSIIISLTSTRIKINIFWLGMIALGFLIGNNGGINFGLAMFWLGILSTPILIIINWIITGFEWGRFNNQNDLKEFGQKEILDNGSFLK